MPNSLRPIAWLLPLLLAAPAGAEVTFDPAFTQAVLLTSAETFSDSSERDDDQDIADGVAELDRTLESVAGDAGKQARAKVTVRSSFSPGLITMSGSFQVSHEVGSLGESEGMDSRAELGLHMGFCTTEPLSFQLSANASVFGSSQLFRQEGDDEPEEYTVVDLQVVDQQFVQVGINTEIVDDQPDQTLNAAANTMSGELPAGCHSELLSIQLSAQLQAALAEFVRGGAVNPPETRGQFSLSLALFPAAAAPNEGDVFSWVGPAQGAFNTEANWQSDTGAPGVPGFVSFEDADTAIVSSASPVTIDLAAAALARGPRGPLPERKTGRLQVRGVTPLRPLGGTLVLDSLTPDLLSRSLEVSGGATLLLDGGGIQARHVTLGAVGDGTLEVVGPDGFFTTLGRFGIGGGDDGNLTIRGGATVTSAESVLGEVDGSGFALVQGEGSLWQTGNLAVGFADAAGVTIEAGARVESEKAFVDCRFGTCSGLEDLERSEVTVTGEAAGGTPSSWLVVDELQIGPLGKVSVAGGAEIEGDLGIIRIGTGSGAADCLAGQACLDLVEGRVDVGGIDVGATGPGKMQIGPLGRATALAIVFVGANPLAQGELVVTGPSAEPQLVSPIGVGVSVGSHGELLLQGGARVTASSASAGGGGPGASGRIEVRDDSVLRVADSPGTLAIGSDEPDDIFGPTGELELVNGRVELDEAELEIRNTGRLFGTGRVDGFGVSLVTNNGEIGCGVTINAPYVQGANGVALCPQAILSPVSFPQLNPLAASRFARALRARPPPPPVPAPGPFVVNGDATLDGTLVLQFLNGFAPSQGDAFDLIDVSGTVTGAFANVEVRGLAPGAGFTEDFAAGKLTLTSLSDAEALPTVSVKSKPLLKETVKFKKGLKVKFIRKGDTSQALQVAYTVGGTARNGFDYLQVPSVIEIPARKKSAKLVLRPYRDAEPEDDEGIAIEVLPGEGYTPSLFSKVEIVLADEVPKKKKR